MDGGLDRILVRGGKGSLSRTYTVLLPLDLYRQQANNTNKMMMATKAMTAMNQTLRYHSVLEAVLGSWVAGS